MYSNDVPASPIVTRGQATGSCRTMTTRDMRRGQGKRLLVFRDDQVMCFVGGCWGRKLRALEIREGGGQINGGIWISHEPNIASRVFFVERINTLSYLLLRNRATNYKLSDCQT